MNRYHKAQNILIILGSTIIVAAMIVGMYFIVDEEVVTKNKKVPVEKVEKEPKKAAVKDKPKKVKDKADEKEDDPEQSVESMLNQGKKKERVAEPNVKPIKPTITRPTKVSRPEIKVEGVPK